MFCEVMRMIILPAIDIQNGECVRLYQGDFSTAHKVSDSPQETAAQFRKAGAEWAVQGGTGDVLLIRFGAVGMYKVDIAAFMQPFCQRTGMQDREVISR